MKKTFLSLWAFGMVVVFLATAQTGMKISQYPSTNNVPAGSLVLITSGATNMNVRQDKFAAAFHLVGNTNGVSTNQFLWAPIIYVNANAGGNRKWYRYDSDSASYVSVLNFDADEDINFQVLTPVVGDHYEMGTNKTATMHVMRYYEVQSFFTNASFKGLFKPNFNSADMALMSDLYSIGANATSAVANATNDAYAYTRSATNGMIPANSAGVFTNNGSGTKGWMPISSLPGGGGSVNTNNPIAWVGPVGVKYDLNVGGNLTVASNLQVATLTTPTLIVSQSIVTAGITSTNTTNAGAVYDAAGSKGTAGQVITSDGTKQYWSNAPAGGTSGNYTNLPSLIVTGAFRLLPHTVSMAPGATKSLIDLAVGNRFKLLLHTNTELVFSNIEAGIVPGDVLLHQDTNGGWAVTYRVSGGLALTNKPITCTTNANATDVLEFQTAYFATNLLLTMTRTNYMPYVVDTNSWALGWTVPAITTDLTNITCLTNTDATFTIAASGTAPLTNFWTTNGVNTTSNGTTLLLSAVPAGLSNCAVQCVVSNAYGFATSAIVHLTITNGVGGVTLLTSNIAYWKLDEAVTSGTRYDSSGNGYNLADASNNCSYGGSTLGIISNCISPAGTVGWLTNASGDISAFQVGGNQNFTWSFWFRKDSIGTPTAAVVDKGAFNLTGDEYLIYFDANGYPKFAVGSGAAFASITTNNAFTDNSWHHCLAWYDGSSVNIRVDCGGIMSSNAPSGTQTTTGKPLSFIHSSSGAAQGYTRKLDEVGFWRRALTLAEHTNLWNSGNGLSYTNFATTP